MTRWLITLCFFTHLALAQNQRFQFPVDCQLNKNCYIQLYVDNGSGDQVIDFKGGYLTNDKHTGTDIAIATYEAMDKGIAVLAAADGTVLGIRDGEVDHYDREYDYDESKACGNGIMIRHTPTWTTQYCHMKQGSVNVKTGDKIKTGDKLGLIGSSGRADFPHLHFTIRHYGKVVDPFPAHLWQEPINYVPFGMIDMGLSNHKISVDDVLDRAPRKTQFTAQDELILAWIRVFGVEQDDILRFKFYTPQNTLFGTPSSVRINKHYKEWFSMAGFNLSEATIAHLNGQWHVEYEYKRGNSEWVVLGRLAFSVGK